MSVRRRIPPDLSSIYSLQSYPEDYRGRWAASPTVPAVRQIHEYIQFFYTTGLNFAKECVIIYRLKFL